MGLQEFEDEASCKSIASASKIDRFDAEMVCKIQDGNDAQGIDK